MKNINNNEMVNTRIRQEASFVDSVLGYEFDIHSSYSRLIILIP